MHLRIRADIFNAALQAIGSGGGNDLRFNFMFLNSENEWLTFDRLAREVPELETELQYFESQWDGVTHPALSFFSIDPPGTWMRLRKLIGPDSMDLMDLHEELDSHEAFGVVLQAFMPALELQQDQWYQNNYIP